MRGKPLQGGSMPVARPYPSVSEIVGGFAPGWFASVMGTGALALTTLFLSRTWPWLALPARILNGLNFVLFAALLIPWLLRWLRYRQAALAALNNPAASPFYPTIAIGMLVLAAQAFHFRMGAPLALGVWWIAVILTFGFNFIILYKVFMHESVSMDDVTAAHFIPAVGLVVIPVAGVPLLGHMQGTLRELALLVNAAGLGAAVLLYIGLFCLLFYRHYMHPPIPGKLVPTIWIHLAPLGWMPVDVMALADYLALPGALETAKVLALLVWGAGLWWTLMALLLTLSARRKGQLPFSLAWWSFIFPIGAMVTLSFQVAARLDFALASACGTGLWLLMAFFWCAALGGTLKRVASGEIWR